MRVLMRALLASLTLLSLACSAQDSGELKYELGKHYKAVAKVAKPVDPKRITVEEFFWYGCKSCYAFEPVIGPWAAKKAPDVDFVQFPASLGRPEGVVHQKAFYAAEALGVGAKIHKALFDGIHEKNQKLFTQDSLAAFFNAETGVLPDLFNSTFTGFAVDSRVRLAETRAKDYGVFSVPTVVVGGQYQTTPQLAGTFAETAKVIDFLVAKVRKERK